MDWPICKLQVCNINKFAQDEWQKVNKHLKFDANFDIWRQFKHFEYDMNCTLEKEKWRIWIGTKMTLCMP